MQSSQNKNCSRNAILVLGLNCTSIIFLALFIWLRQFIYIGIIFFAMGLIQGYFSVLRRNSDNRLTTCDLSFRKLLIMNILTIFVASVTNQFIILSDIFLLTILLFFVQMYFNMSLVFDSAYSSTIVARGLFSIEE